MKKIQVKLVITMIAILAMLFLLPIQVFGTNEEMQMIKTNNEDYIIYIKELQNTSFEFAITQSLDTEEMDRNYQSAEDDNGNHVVLISKEKYEEISGQNNYLFVKKDGKLIIEGIKLDFNQVFTTQNMEQVELTSKKIETQLITDITEKDEEINGVKVKITVGGLKINAKENSNYYYAITKLPSERYDTLKELADKINTDYEKSDMYSKIDLSKQFYSLYSDLADEQDWKKVDNYTILQPNDAKKGDQYVVYIKEVDENQNETVDVKFMTSYREDEEEKIPGRTESKIVKETTKLPITGDSIILFVILAVIVIVAVIVFIRMKKLQNAKTGR
ncbi:MAG: hypothetical protein IJE05_05065 [Clostridia bacterium]|nr:hypothetical protein [Clostridia bacterium]